MGHTFMTRYKEHIKAVRTNTHDSKCAQHVLDMGHTYSNIESPLRIPKITIT